MLSSLFICNTRICIHLISLKLYLYHESRIYMSQGYMLSFNNVAHVIGSLHKGENLRHDHVHIFSIK